MKLYRPTDVRHPRAEKRRKGCVAGGNDMMILMTGFLIAVIAAQTGSALLFGLAAGGIIASFGLASLFSASEMSLTALLFAFAGFNAGVFATVVVALAATKPAGDLAD